MRYTFFQRLVSGIGVLGLLLSSLTMQPVQAVTCPQLQPGDLFKTTSDTSVWQIGPDGAKRYFPHASVYSEWQPDFSQVQSIDPACFDQYPDPVAAPYGVNFPPGTFIKRVESPSVYVVGTHNRVWKVRDGEAMRQLRQNGWNTDIRTVSSYFWQNYDVQQDVFDGTGLIDGVVVKDSDGVCYVYVDGTLYRVQGTIFSPGEAYTIDASESFWQQIDDRIHQNQAVAAASLHEDPTQLDTRYVYVAYSPEDVVSPKDPIENNSDLTAVWANDGGEKIVQSELRGTEGGDTINSVWSGETLQLFGAKNEIVGSNLVLEAGNQTVDALDVTFDRLTGPNGAVIASRDVEKNDVFDWNDRNIELFYVRYLEIKGMSAFCCNVSYDERHAPEKFRRPFDPMTGIATGSWYDRPHHNQKYPDIAVPLEAERPFTIQQGTNQSIWIDIYIPKNVPAGQYTGTLTITQHGSAVAEIPVELDVQNFTLPDEPTTKTMVPMTIGDVNNRFFGEQFPIDPATLAQSEDIRNEYYKLAHRHKISLVDDDVHHAEDRPSDAWMPRLDGSLYTAANGYVGPGMGVGNDLFVVGLYGSWRWKDGGETAMRQHTDQWEQWFRDNSPDTERFLYLIDESHDYAQINTWARWINANPGVGRHLKSMATLWVNDAVRETPELDIVASTMYVAPKDQTEQSVRQLDTASDKNIYFYNGGRPGQGSFVIEDDGIALRQVAWGQYKKGIDRWFYWNATYYNNYQAGHGETDLFSNAHTFGANSQVDSIKGETGWNYNNGDGVLMYPGTDRVYQASSYDIPGPIASLRMKQWRRGIQDVDYIALAMQKDPARTQAIIEEMVPKVLWEYDVDDLNDPTWKRTDISWSTDPDDWEEARRALAQIIEG